MKEKRNLHLKVQEMADCYATTDPLRGMSAMQKETEVEEAAVKWLALAVLHGVNDNAEKITISHGADGRVKVLAEYRTKELPPPSPGIAAAVVQAIREITHIEEDRGKLPLSIGIRNNTVDITVSLKVKNGEDKISLKFE
jgi:hypothetical protein